LTAGCLAILVGASERYLITRSHLGIYNNVGLTIGYSWTRKEDSTHFVLLKSIIHLAIARAIAEHPCLSVVPAGEETNDPYYTRLPIINLGHAVSFIQRRTSYNGNEDLELDEILQGQHNAPFLHSDIDLPYWRLLILTHPGDDSDFFAAFIFHHAICDTRSAVLFHQTFGEEFTRANAELQIPSAPPADLVITPQITMLPSIESLTSFPLSPDFKNNFISSVQKPTSHFDHVWTGEPGRLPVQTRFCSLCIPASTTCQLVCACKEHGTTVTAAIQTAVASVLFASLPPWFTTLNCDGAISLLNLLPNPPISSSTMGVFVRPFPETHQREALSSKNDQFQANANVSSSFSDPTASSFWSEARRSRQNLKNILTEPNTDNPFIAMTLLAEMNISLSEYMLSKLGKKRPVSYEVSNIGTVTRRKQDDAEEGARVLEMGRTVFSQSAVANNAPLKISVATGGDGRLNLGFTWQAGSVVAVAGDEDHKEEDNFVVEGLIRGVRRFLEGIVGGSA
jgi:hypothetical protein